ncbi:hypothetical protein AD006_32590 (plasmid) [Pseudonocardia sp. EC080610-09]|uniref:hypothetical protein n=1 Tax=Pseudonocardia sp. EC080610-09 TaxID=1688404 RepID=UPI000705A9DB|nr:hypothetical protein [Pseudonocardia sp. EC080610-09]ALL79956.1 hypothetical protein AD006_32590 [Pseudonocardia sp. EC080610-09]
MSDRITITLVSGAERHRPSEPIDAPADDPHQIWAHVLELADRIGGLTRHADLAEIAFAETGLPLYNLRCR